MIAVILLFGVLLVSAGLLTLVKPALLLSFLSRNVEKPLIHILAVIVRLILGLLLVINASLSKYPVVIEVIGWLSILAALIFAVMGRQKFSGLMTWVLTLFKSWGRLIGVVAVLFGVFLISAFA